jgi:demethylmenaquinone methyltransferase/2-methoxy-6-polyprenyl-1,4-benzoquinol methylase
MPDIYDESFLKRLFDDMQGTYTRMSVLASFNFNQRWRQRLACLMDVRPGMRVGDLMTGSGEMWPLILPRIGTQGALLAVDFSSISVEQAQRRKASLEAKNVTILHEDALYSSIPVTSLDRVFCAYGVKTLSPERRAQFVQELWRILKPGGEFGLVEVSAPHFQPLRAIYLFYLKYMIPLASLLLLGNPKQYRMLSVFVETFGDCTDLEEQLAAVGFAVGYMPFFGGCASAVIGVKPE